MGFSSVNSGFSGASGGGGGSSSITFTDITYANLATLKSSNSLVAGAIYFITDKNIYLQALSTNGLSTWGIYKATNADYNNVTGNFLGVWAGTTTMEYTYIGGWAEQGELVTGGTSGAIGEVMYNNTNNLNTFFFMNLISKNGIAFTGGETWTSTSGASGTVGTFSTTAILGTIAQNKLVAWNNKHWKNLTGSATIIHPKYDPTNWEELPITDSSYQIEYDPIIYKFESDLIIGHWDKRANVVIDPLGVSTLRFQWGRNTVFGNEISSFGFEGWNAINAQDYLTIQDSSCYIGDTASLRFSTITGRSTTAFVRDSLILAGSVWHGNLLMAGGGANHVKVGNGADVVVNSSSASIGDCKFIKCNIIVSGTSQLAYCGIESGSGTAFEKTFNNENHSNKNYLGGAYSTFETSISQDTALTTLTLDSSLLYGVYNVTITGGNADIDTIANMPPFMPISIVVQGSNNLTFTESAGIRIIGRLYKTLLPVNKDWIKFQNINSLVQEISCSLVDLVPFFSACDTTTQAIDTADVPQLVTFDTIEVEQGIVATSSSRFTISQTGTYYVIANFQINSTSANKNMDLWIRVNGTDVPNSLSKNNIANSNDEKDIAHIITVPIVAGDYIEIVINGDSTDLTLTSYPAGTSPTRPVAPSIYLKIQKII